MTFESKTTKQNLLKLHSVLQCKHSASTCKGPVFNKFNSRSTSSKETKILLFKLGQTYAGSEDPKYCSWIRDSFSRKLCVGKTTQPSTFKSETIQASQGGTQGNVVKRCNTASITIQKSVPQQPLSCIKEGWRQHTNNKFETSEQFHPITALQNGLLQNMLQKKNYICKLDQKRRLFLVFSKKRNKEIYTVSLGSDTLRVPLSLFWSKSSYSNIYQNLNLPISLLRRLEIHLIIYSSSPTNITFRLGDSVEMKTICSLKKGGRDCSNVSKCNGRQLDPKGFDKVTGEIDLHNSSNFIS